jgi:hypothetical protein
MADASTSAPNPDAVTEGVFKLSNLRRLDVCRRLRFLAIESVGKPFRSCRPARSGRSRQAWHFRVHGLWAPAAFAACLDGEKRAPGCPLTFAQCRRATARRAGGYFPSLCDAIDLPYSFESRHCRLIDRDVYCRHLATNMLGEAKRQAAPPR